MGEFARLEVEGAVGTIRLDRPKMNALDAQMQEEIRELAEQATADPAVRAVVLYGGERVFAAGADIKEMAAMSYVDMLGRARRLQDCFRAVAQIPKPVIAAITGYALGGGCELSMCADFRVVADDAKMGQPEILLGIIPGAGGTQRLTRLVGPAKAKDIIFTGRFVDAAEALAIGLADRVVPKADVYTTAVEMAAGVRERPGGRAARGQAGGRRRHRARPRQRAAAREPALRLAVRHRGPRRRHGELHRQRPRQGGVHRAVVQGVRRPWHSPLHRALSASSQRCLLQFAGWLPPGNVARHGGGGRARVAPRYGAPHPRTQSARVLPRPRLTEVGARA